MANTVLDTGSIVQKYFKNFFAEYVREQQFRAFMGSAVNNGAMPILTNYELARSGQIVNIPLVDKSTGRTRGSTELVGRETALGNSNQPIKIGWNRNAHTITKDQEHWSAYQIAAAAKSALKHWATEELKFDIITSLMNVKNESVVGGLESADADADGQTPIEYWDATSDADKNSWLVANADRVLFGAARANGASGVHATALAEIDGVADKLTPAVVSLAKSMALETSLAGAGKTIRPFKTSNNATQEDFVMFCNSRAFSDLKNSDAMTQANRDARPRDTGSNPIFQDGDLLWDGVIIRQIPEIPVLAGEGAGGIDVAPNFFCGAGAVGVAWGQEPMAKTRKEDDYGFIRGVGIEEARGCSKIFRNDDVQNGMVTVYTSGVPQG